MAILIRRLSMTTYITLNGVTNSAFGLFYTILISRGLAPSEFADYIFIQSIFSFYLIFQDMHLQNRGIALWTELKNKGRQEEYLLNVLVIRFVLAIFGASLICLIASYYELNNFFYIIGIQLLFYGSYCPWLYIATNTIREVFIKTTSLRILLIIPLINLDGMNLILGYIASNIIIYIIASQTTLRFLDLSKSINWTEIKDILSDGILGVTNSFSVTSYRLFPVILISRIPHIADYVAVYYIAEKVARAIGMITAPLGSAVIDHQSKKKFDNVRNTGALMMFVSLASFLALNTYSHYIMDIFSIKKTSNSNMIFLIMSFIPITVSVASYISGKYLLSRKNYSRFSSCLRKSSAAAIITVPITAIYWPNYMHFTVLSLELLTLFLFYQQAKNGS